MSLVTRIAVVIAATFLLAAAAATFLPTEPSGVEGCGSWVAPELSDDEYDGMIEDYSGMYDDASRLGMGGDVYGGAANLARMKRACDDALATRRTLTIFLLGGAILVPAGVLFVGKRRDQELVA